MQQTTSCSRRARTSKRRASMAAGLAMTIAVAAASCSSDGASPGTSDPAPTIVPDETAVAPGACDPSEAVDAPAIEVGGTTTPATLGLADVGCAGTNGDGYISFNYNPVLIDGEGDVTVTVADGVGAVLTWTGQMAFAETSPGVWSSTLDPASCHRLTIQLTSVSGTSTATYGADIRTGGDAVECPQRDLDPAEEPSETGGTLAPPPGD